MSSDSHHEPNGESNIPLWLYLTGIGALVLTLAAFGIMILGML